MWVWERRQQQHTIEQSGYLKFINASQQGHLEVVQYLAEYSAEVKAGHYIYDDT